MSYHLYYSNYCYFCQKVLTFLNGRTHQISLLSTSDHAHRSSLMAGGGKTQVPCLRITDSDGKDSWLYESDDILAYINSHGLAA
jgi:glutathione S-transferase